MTEQGKSVVHPAPATVNAYNKVCLEKIGLNLEIQKPNKENIKKNQRIISSESLIQDFNYTFIHPNPKYF